MGNASMKGKKIVMKGEKMKKINLVIVI